MGTLQFISGKAAMETFMAMLREDINDDLDTQNVNASGRLKRSNTVTVSESPASITGTLMGLTYWVNANSGTPPGTNVSLDALVQWAKDKGLVNNDRAALRLAFTTQKKIRAIGSRGFREGRPNTYEERIKRNADQLPDVLRACMKDIDAGIITEFKTIRA